MGKGTTSKRGKDGRKPARPLDREPPADVRPKTRNVPDERQDADAPAVQFKPPLKPRRGLFLLLTAVFALWFGFLLYLYFKTEYGRGLEQHAPTGPTPAGVESTR